MRKRLNWAEINLHFSRRCIRLFQLHSCLFQLLRWLSIHHHYPQLYIRRWTGISQHCGWCTIHQPWCRSYIHHISPIRRYLGWFHPFTDHSSNSSSSNNSTSVYPDASSALFRNSGGRRNWRLARIFFTVQYECNVIVIKFKVKSQLDSMLPINCFKILRCCQFRPNSYQHTQISTLKWTVKK